MATNQMRREAAKRKLARQQERRAREAARRKRNTAIIAGTLAVLLVVGVMGFAFLYPDSDTPEPDAAAPAPAAATAGCTWVPDGQAAKPVEAPTVTDPQREGTVAVTLDTNRGAIPLTLDRAKAPCTVESFVHLAQAGYFDATQCHRLTTQGIQVLQCGDPSGTGSGGPGYSFPDETTPDMTYPRGTLAMANAGPDTNGSQFFMVYGDSPLPPNYTVFGTIGEPGLQVLDQIAAAGLANGAQGDGAPAQPVTITKATVS